MLTSFLAIAVIAAGTLGGVRDLGRAPASVRVHIALVLNHHHEAELNRLVEAQADRRSPIYHHFLAPAQFRAYFAPTPAEYGRAIAALERGGFTIVQTFPNEAVVDASAPAPVAARYFGTDIHRVLSPELGLTYTNITAGIVPSDIADITQGVFGLDGTDISSARPIRAPRDDARAAHRNARRNGEPLFGPDGGYGPQIFIDAYALPAANGNTGTGRTSGVDMAGDFLDSDLAAYLSYFGVTRTGPASTRIPVDGGAPKFPGGDASETTLDVETIVSLAPGTGLYVYEIPSLSDSALVDVFNRVVSDNLVDTLNSSWDNCETVAHESFAKSLDTIEQEGEALGITFHSSAGDWGSHGVNCRQTVSVNIPSATPDNVAVGGTSLAVDPNTGQETSEVGWSGPGSDATGGGVSRVFKLPAYQKDVPNIIAGGRNLPDLAFEASSLIGGESFYFDGSFDGPTGGTSLASPVFGAGLAEINQLQNSRSGDFNVTLYETWLANGYASGSTSYFRDITQGSIPPYYAQTGYDQMTGIGAMQVTNFYGLLNR